MEARVELARMAEGMSLFPGTLCRERDEWRVTCGRQPAKSRRRVQFYVSPRNRLVAMALLSLAGKDDVSQ